jgi:DNA-directed RNA polymerase omega subunit
MGYPPLEKLLEKSNYSVYRLVRMAAMRATELADGSPRLIEAPAEEKTATIALEEINAGKVVLTEVADKFKPATESKQEKASE